MIGTERPGRGYVADYRLHGKRVRLSFDTARERDAHLDEARDLLRRERGLARDVDRRKTVAVYAAEWLGGLEGSVKPATLTAYTKACELYIVPRLGERLVAELQRRDIKAFLRECRHEGVRHAALLERGRSVARIRKRLSSGSVYAIYATLRALLFEAVEDEIIPGNPAVKLGRKLHLQQWKQHLQAAVKARVLLRERLRELLEYVRTQKPQAYPLVLTLARTGVRVAELVALELGDFDAEESRLTVARQWSEKHKALTTPEHGARVVDVSPSSPRFSPSTLPGCARSSGSNGKPRAAWLFPSQEWGRLGTHHVRRLLAGLATSAALGRPVRPHDLRHTFGSQLTALGKPPQYIQQQLGHASIQMTIDLYGSGLPLSYQHGVADLDDAPSVAPNRLRVVTRRSQNRARAPRCDMLTESWTCPLTSGLRPRLHGPDAPVARPYVSSLFALRDVGR